MDQTFTGDISSSVGLDAKSKELVESMIKIVEKRLFGQPLLLEEITGDIGQVVTRSTLRSTLSATGCLRLGNQQIDVTSKPMMVDLFAAFLSSPTLYLKKPELIRAVYGRSPQNCSARQYACDRHNIVKLVSRARGYLREHLSDEFLRQWEVLFHDKVRQGWSLLTPKIEI